VLLQRRTKVPTIEKAAVHGYSGCHPGWNNGRTALECWYVQEISVRCRVSFVLEESACDWPAIILPVDSERNALEPELCQAAIEAMLAYYGHAEIGAVLKSSRRKRERQVGADYGGKRRKTAGK
jgi:hypothetical protein